MQHTVKLFAAASVAALITLAGCNKQSHTITAGDAEDPQANALAAAAPVQLPPSITASRIYRCKDNSLFYIDFLSDQKSATIRSKKDGSPTLLAAPAAGEAFVADGYKLVGSGSQITLTAPGRGSQSCKA